MHDSVNVGIAIALEDGLLAPALLDCQALDLGQTAVALDDLVGARTRRRAWRLEMGTSTFTLSNLGMFDVTSFSAIVIPPQVAILAIGARRFAARSWSSRARRALGHDCHGVGRPSTRRRRRGGSFPGGAEGPPRRVRRGP